MVCLPGFSSIVAFPSTIHPSDSSSIFPLLPLVPISTAIQPTDERGGQGVLLIRTSLRPPCTASLAVAVTKRK